VGYEALIQALLSEGEAKAREIEVGAEAAARDLVERAAREADDEVAASLRNQPDAVAILHSFSSGDVLLEATNVRQPDVQHRVHHGDHLGR